MLIPGCLAIRLRVAVGMAVFYRVRVSCVGLVVHFRAFSRNGDAHQVVGPEGPDRALRVIPVDDVIAPRLVGLAHRVKRPPIPEGVDKGRVPRGEARDHLTANLLIGHFGPSVGENGHCLVVATGAVGGEREGERVAGGGHGSILPGSRFAWGAREEIS